MLAGSFRMALIPAWLKLQPRQIYLFYPALDVGVLSFYSRICSSSGAAGMRT